MSKRMSAPLMPATQASCLRWLTWLFALLLLVTLYVPVSARTPREELLRLVPGDIGFCLLIEDLRGHGQALLDSPFLKRFAPPLSKMAKADELAKLDFVDHWLQENLHVNAIQLRDEILGDALVFAYR